MSEEAERRDLIQEIYGELPPLHTAAAYRNAREVARLIANGTDVNLLDRRGLAAVELAVGAPTILAMLLAAGANPRMSYAGCCPMRSAICEGCYESFRMLVQRAGLDCCDRPHHKSLIWMASKFATLKSNINNSSHRRMASLLLAAGARAEDRFVCTPNVVRIIANRFDTDHWAVVCSKDAVKAAALNLQRERMTDICIALQSLRLPALTTVLILREACSLPGASLRFAHCWAVATKVKHMVF